MLALWSPWGSLPVQMLKLTQGTTGTGSTLLGAEHQSDFHAITRVLQHRAINMSRETEAFLVGRKWCAAAGILIWLCLFGLRFYLAFKLI